MTIPFVILIFFSFFYINAPLVYFALLLAVPAVITVSTGKTSGEFMLALRLTSSRCWCSDSAWPPRSRSRPVAAIAF